MIVDLFAIQNLKDGLCLLQVDVYFHEAGHIYKEYLLVVQSLLSFLQLLSVGAIILHAHDSFYIILTALQQCLEKVNFSCQIKSLFSRKITEIF